MIASSVPFSASMLLIALKLEIPLPSLSLSPFPTVMDISEMEINY